MIHIFGHIVIPVTGDYKDYVPMFPATLLTTFLYFNFDVWKDFNLLTE